MGSSLVLNSSPSVLRSFISCCNKAGLSLLRSEFLALERSVPKDRFGRFNYYHLAEMVEAVGCTNGVGNLTMTAPDAVQTLRSDAIRARTYA